MSKLEPAIRFLLECLSPDRLTHVVDVGANPLTPPPYSTLFEMGGCHVIGFEPHPEAFVALTQAKTDRETYFNEAVGDGSTETLRIYRDSGLTSIFPPYEGGFRYLGRSRFNMHLNEEVPLATRRLDDIDAIADIDLLKIDIQGGEVKVFEGGERKLRSAVAVIPEIRFYQLYQGEPMFGGIDMALRKQGFQLHKIVEPKAKVIPNTQIDRLKRSALRNQVIDADAVYLRDPGLPDAISDEKMKHMAILACAVFDSQDLALHCLDHLVERGVIPGDSPAEFVDTLPAHLRKD